MTAKEAMTIIRQLNHPEVDNRLKQEAVDTVMGDNTLFYRLKHRDYLFLLPWIYKENQYLRSVNERSKKK